MAMPLIAGDPSIRLEHQIALALQILDETVGGRQQNARYAITTIVAR